MTMDEFYFAQQGWQCPICKRVYSPFTPMCYNCGGENSTSTMTRYTIDWTKLDSITPLDTGIKGDRYKDGYAQGH